MSGSKNDDPRIEWDRPPAREPLFRAPFQVVALAALLLAMHGLRLAFGLSPDLYGLTAGDVRSGRYGGLLSALFVHASWIHVVMNALAVLAFGVPTARLFGPAFRGQLAFVLFFLVCGVLSGLGFVALYPDSGAVLIGASGAASGFVGAAARLMQGQGGLRPAIGRVTIGMSIAWVIANIALGATGLTPGAGDVPVAWQAHLIGYAAGLVLIGPFARLAGAHEPITQ